MSGYGYNQPPQNYGGFPQAQPQYHPTQGGHCPPPNQQQYGPPPVQGGYVAGGYSAPSAYPNQSYSGPPQGGFQGQSAPGPQQSGQTGDRGLLGAVAGGAAGGLLGKKHNHGFLGTVGGAIVGSLLEDKAKKSKKQGHW